MRRAVRVCKEKRLADEPGAVCDLEEAARRARYVGSIEHKTYRSPAGDNPSPRHDASKCPLLPPERWPELTRALQHAIRRGCISEAIDLGALPRYVWGRFEDRFYEARRLSQPADAYKAFPVEPFELPDGVLSRIEGEGERG